ncbi:hypothetical protein AAHE18_07G100000 [Arachis hypogaea]
MRLSLFLQCLLCICLALLLIQPSIVFGDDGEERGRFSDHPVKAPPRSRRARATHP